MPCNLGANVNSNQGKGVKLEMQIFYILNIRIFTVAVPSGSLKGTNTQNSGHMGQTFSN